MGHELLCTIKHEKRCNLEISMNVCFEEDSILLRCDAVLIGT